MSEPLKDAVIRENGGTDEAAVRTEVALRSQVEADEHAPSISGAASAGVGLSRLSETDGQEHHRAAGHLSPAVGAGDRPVRRDAASVVPDAACRCNGSGVVASVDGEAMDCQDCGAGSDAADNLHVARDEDVADDRGNPGCVDSRKSPAATSTGLDLVHIGRSWHGHTLEDACPCGKAPCGLVDGTKIDPACPQHALDAARTMRQAHDAADCIAPHEMDSMGAWSDAGIIWLPRSRYTRAQARTFCADESGERWIDVAVRARWARYAPEHELAAEYDGEFWIECDRDAPGAFQVWRCE